MVPVGLVLCYVVFAVSYSSWFCVDLWGFGILDPITEFSLYADDLSYCMLHDIPFFSYVLLCSGLSYLSSQHGGAVCIL